MYVRAVVGMVEMVTALAELPPGPRLAAALARVDVAGVPNNALLPLLEAQSRQTAHESARLLAVIAEVGRANPTFDDNAVDRLDRPFRHAADEVRAALVWSRRAAESECALAEQLVHHLPAVYAAFLAGEIDRSCAWLAEDGTAVLSARGLSPAQAQAALERIDGLAHAARRAGHPSTLDQIRVDVLAGCSTARCTTSAARR